MKPREMSYCAACEGLHPVVDGKLAKSAGDRPCRAPVGLRPEDCVTLRGLVCALQRRADGAVDGQPDHHAIADRWTAETAQRAILRGLAREEEVALMFAPGDARASTSEDARSALAWLVMAATKGGAR